MTVRVALLMNFVAPYRVPLFRSLRRKLDEFRIFISTPMEPDRPWSPNWADLDVVVQRTVTVPSRHRRNGFDQQLFIHFPYDTLPRLFRYAPDVVVSGEFGLRSLQAALYRRLRLRSRLIVWATLSEYTETGWGSLRGGLRKLILRAADAVIVNGASGARYIRSVNTTVPVFTMNQPVNLPPFLAVPLDRPSEAARRLIFSGRLIGQKGVIEFQRAAANWAQNHPNLKLDLIWLGDGELRKTLEAMPLPNNFEQHFLGYAAYDALPAIYQSAGALVLPSLYDEWGLVVNEAMASGLPVLGSRYSQAVEEMVTDGCTGWQLDPLIPETMEAAIDKLFSTSDAILAEMRCAARARAAMITPEGAAACMLAAIHAVTPTSANSDETIAEPAK